MHLAQELLMNISGGSGSFAKKTRALKMRSAVAGIGSWQPPTERIINDSLSTTRVKELNVAHSMVAQHFKQIGKVKKLSKWVPHELTKIKKKLSFWSIVFLFYATKMNHFFITSWCATKSGLYMKLVRTSSVAGSKRSSKALPKVKPAPEKGHDHWPT